MLNFSYAGQKKNMKKSFSIIFN